MSEPTINILQRTDCEFEYEMRGETYLKVKRRPQPLTVWMKYICKCVCCFRAKAQRQPTG